jgi:hypothetical protein
LAEVAEVVLAVDSEAHLVEVVDSEADLEVVDFQAEALVEVGKNKLYYFLIKEIKQQY